MLEIPGGKRADDTLRALGAEVCAGFVQVAVGGVMESQELRKVGLKVTHPRMRILEILETVGARHMTAEDIYKQLIGHDEDIGLATVYRVLTQFEAAGLVLKHNFEGGQAVYELDRGKHHDHMVDLDTGKVIEFTSEEIERLQREIADRHGYVIEEHSLVLYVRPKKKKA
jgi:Fur family transcriptional regulator, ferric uptake regulator